MEIAAGPVRGASKKTVRRWGEALTGYGFIALPMLILFVFNIGAILFALYISVWQWNLRLGGTRFIGLQDYQTALSDPVFQKAITNTLYYTVVWVPLTMALGLLLAVLVNQKVRGLTFFRAAFYFPAIASSAAITTLWVFMLAPDGLFNGVRAVMGINPIFAFLGFGPSQNWLGDQTTAMNSIIILNAWTTSGTFMLFYLASLQSIGTELYEAAALDGANAWHAFWRITFPLLRPAHFFIATVAVIGGMQLFDQAFIGGGVNGDPNFSLMTVVLYVYNTSFHEFDFDYAAALGMILFVVIFTATLIQRRLFGQAPQW
jgi:ABC-type sugar transport system permease subunit